MKIILATIAIVAMFATGSHAQIITTSTSGPPTSAFAADPIIRISSVFKTTVPMPDGQAIPDPKAQETARRELYQTGENECVILSEVYKAECRLTNMTLLTLIANVASGPPPNVITASAVYELRVRNPAR